MKAHGQFPEMPPEDRFPPPPDSSANPSRVDELAKRMVPLSGITAALSHNYLVKGWLSRGALSMLYGPSNAGKTFVALDLALHVAAGQPWRGFKVNGGPVLYVAAEGGAGVRNRLTAFKIERPVMASTPFILLPIGLDLHGPGDALAVCTLIAVVRPVLIVIDTLARSMGAGDENTAKDAAMFIRNCDIIRAATCAHVLVIHHTGKDEERGARGSSALRAAVDTEINVTSDGQIICRKQRDVAIPQPLGFALRPVVLGVDEDGDTVTSAVVDAAEVARKDRKPLTGQNEVAMQALQDALCDHGETKSGSHYPRGRKVVRVDRWREACAVHGITQGSSDSAARMAFTRAKAKLMDMDLVREFDGFVWQVRGDG